MLAKLDMPPMFPVSLSVDKPLAIGKRPRSILAKHTRYVYN